MADESDEQSWRPILLALAALAVVGWAAAGFIWWQGWQTQASLTEQLTAADRARESLASDLQNLEKTFLIVFLLRQIFYWHRLQFRGATSRVGLKR